MTEPLSSAEIAEAKALILNVPWPQCAALHKTLSRALATIEAKDAEIATERHARQEAERMLAEAIGAIELLNQRIDEYWNIEGDAPTHGMINRICAAQGLCKPIIARHRARQAKGES